MQGFVSKEDTVKRNKISWTALIPLCFLTLWIAGCTVPTLSTVLKVDRTVVCLGEQANLECTVSHVQGNITYEWFCNGGAIEGEGPTVKWIAPESAGAYLVGVRVIAENGKTGRATTTIKVTNNHLPVIDEVIVTAEHKYLRKMAEPNSYLVGKAQQYQIECQAHDLDKDSLTYEWHCSAGNLQQDGSKATWIAPDAVVDVKLTVKVSDSKKGMAMQELLLKVVACSACTFR